MSEAVINVSPVRRSVLFPDHYAWYVLAATLDVIVTHQILHEFQGSEVNKIADALIARYGLLGMIGLKYSSIIVVVLICEFIGRRNVRLGRRLAVAAICLSALPVGVGLLQLAVWTHLVPHGIGPPAQVEWQPSEGGGFGAPPPTLPRR